MELQRGFRESTQLNGVILLIFKVPWQVLGDPVGWKRVPLSCYGAITPESVTKEYLHVKIMRGVRLKSVKRVWRDGSEVKSTSCSSRGPEFNSQQPYGGLQPSIMRPGTLSWPTSIHADRALYT